MMGTPTTEVDRLLQAARLHLAQGELHETVERADEAIHLEGGRADAYLLRAEALRRLKKPERALADLAVAIRLAPDRPGPYIVRAEILKRRNVFDQAIADATHALILDPRNASAFSVRAQCRHAVGDREGADDDVRAMLEIDPTHAAPDFPAPWHRLRLPLRSSTNASGKSPAMDTAPTIRRCSPTASRWTRPTGHARP